MSVGRKEMYPWSKLRKPGDWFFVRSSMKTSGYMSALVAQRNHKLRGAFRYSCSSIEGGCFIILTECPEFEVSGIEFTPEIILHENAIGEISMTQEQRINLMGFEMKCALLPWWYENGKFFINSKIATAEDKNKYNVRREHPPGANDPYPSYYNLDENLRPIKKEANSVRIVNKYAWEDDTEEEDTSYEEESYEDNDEIGWDHDYVLPENEEKPADDEVNTDE